MKFFGPYPRNILTLPWWIASGFVALFILSDRAWGPFPFWTYGPVAAIYFVIGLAWARLFDLSQRDAEGAAANPQSAITSRFPMTDRARSAVARAKAVAQARGNVEPQALDLLIALADNDGGVAHHVLEQAGLANPGLREQLARDRASHQSPASQCEPGLNELLERASKECGPLGHKYIGTEHLLLAIAQTSPASEVAEALAQAGIDPQALRDEVRSILGHPAEAG